MGNLLFDQVKDAILQERGCFDVTILAVYLFGSCVTERVDESSDIDLAFLLDEKKYKADPVKAIAPAHKAATSIGMKLNRETDVTILNASSLEIAYEAITSGKCIYEADKEKRLEYEIALKGMYFDFRPFIENLRSACVKSL